MIVAPYLYSAANGYMWLIYAMVVVASIAFICIFLKETKGLSEEQVKKLYRVRDELIDESSKSSHSINLDEDLSQNSVQHQQQLQTPSKSGRHIELVRMESADSSQMTR